MAWDFCRFWMSFFLIFLHRGQILRSSNLLLNSQKMFLPKVWISIVEFFYNNHRPTNSQVRFQLENIFKTTFHPVTVKWWNDQNSLTITDPVPEAPCPVMFRWAPGSTSLNQNGSITSLVCSHILLMIWLFDPGLSKHRPGSVEGLSTVAKTVSVFATGGFWYGWHGHRPRAASNQDRHETSTSSNPWNSTRPHKHTLFGWSELWCGSNAYVNTKPLD